MNRKELIDELAERFEGNRKVAAHALDSVVDVITKSVSAGEKVVITGFGAFERRLRKMGDDAGEYVPEFRPGKELSEVVSGARSMRERVTQSLAVVPAAAAGVAQHAGRAAASGLRAAAGKARDLADAAPKPGSGRKQGDASSRPAKKSSATKTPAKKQAPAKTPAKRAAASRTPAKKSTAKKTPAKKQASATREPTKKASAKRTTAKKVPAKKQATATATQTPATGTAADQAPPAP
jgi:DNA-binding protein HU-beta